MERSNALRGRNEESNQPDIAVQMIAAEFNRFDKCYVGAMPCRIMCTGHLYSTRRQARGEVTWTGHLHRSRRQAREEVTWTGHLDRSRRQVTWRGHVDRSRVQVTWTGNVYRSRGQDTCTGHVYRSCVHVTGYVNVQTK